MLLVSRPVVCSAASKSVRRFFQLVLRLTRLFNWLLSLSLCSIYWSPSQPKANWSHLPLSTTHPSIPIPVTLRFIPSTAHYFLFFPEIKIFPRYTFSWLFPSASPPKPRNMFFEILLTQLVFSKTVRQPFFLEPIKVATIWLTPNPGY